MSENRTVLSAFLVVMAVVSWFVSPFEAYAVPAAPLIHTLSQPDGSNFKARQWGDEFLNGWETEDGYTILFDKERKRWTYAVKEEGRLVSSSTLVKEDTRPLGTPKHIRPSRSTAELFSVMTAEDDYQPFASPASPTGTANIPVLLIRFYDTTTTYTPSDFDMFLFGTGNYSMKEYYQEVSYGLFNISAGPGGIGGWYDTESEYGHGHDYYGYNQGQGWVRAAELAKEAIEEADEEFNFAPYDRDGDCYVDVIAIIHQGDGAEASGDQTDIWSHSWSLIYAGVGEYTTNDDCLATPSLKVKVDKYVMQPETLSGGMPTIGVFAHEYGHALGLPDLYDVDYTSQGTGNWSVMAGGTWNYVSRIGDRPAHMDAWSKYLLGWVTPTEVSGTLVNEPITQASTAADVYKLLSGTPLSGEYFLVENRQKTGFDAGLPGAGLLIWHIDAAQSGNTNECYPGGPSCALQHYKVSLVQADNLWDMEKNFNRGDAGDPYPGSTGKTTFNAASSPNSAFYNGSPSGVSITGISASGSTMYCTLSLSGQYTLTVAKAGTGSGTVTSTPAGIDCGSDCSEPYNPGATVTLTAAPVAGSVFTGWSGAGCSGAGGCVVTMNDDTTVTAAFNVQAPDLTEAALTVSKSGTSLRIDDRVANQGTEPTGAFDISYYLSLDNSYSAGTDTYLCRRSVAGLAAGASNPAGGTTRTTCPIPSVPARSYYVIAVADSGSTVAESNETNNTRPASVSITGVDLLPTAITASKSGSNAVSVSDTVKNQGSSNSSGSFTIRYYLSTDTTYQSGTDIALARSSDGTGTCYRTVNSLSAGSNSSVSNKTCYKPGGAVNGVNYYVIVVDDTGNTVSEYNESNNSRPTTGTINW